MHLVIILKYVISTSPWHFCWPPGLGAILEPGPRTAAADLFGPEFSGDFPHRPERGMAEQLGNGNGNGKKTWREYYVYGIFWLKRPSKKYGIYIYTQYIWGIYWNIIEDMCIMSYSMKYMELEYIYIIYREYCYIEYMVPQNLFWRLKFEQKWRLWNYELWAKQGKLDHWIHYVIPNQLDR